MTSSDCKDQSLIKTNSSTIQQIKAKQQASPDKTGVLQTNNKKTARKFRKKARDCTQKTLRVFWWVQNAAQQGERHWSDHKLSINQRRVSDQACPGFFAAQQRSPL